MSTGVGERALKNLRTVRVFHPMVLSLTPVLGLYAQNASVTPAAVLVRPAVILVASSFTLWILCWILFRDRYRGGVVASVLVLAFCVLWGVLEDTINSAVRLLSPWPPQTFYLIYVGVALVGIGVFLYRYRRSRRAIKNLLVVMVPVAIAGFAVATFLFAPVFGRRAAWIITAYLVITTFAVIAVLRYRGDYRALTPSANWFAGILIALYCVVVLFNRTPAPNVDELPLDMKTAETAASSDSAPDIYFIALDGYPRSDILRSTYAFNNMAFEGSLRDLGFTIAPQSHSNYAIPACALSACLNLDYLDALVAPADRSKGTVDTVLDFYRSNRVFSFLRGQGYKIIATSPGVQSLELSEPNVDICIDPPRTPGEFEVVLAGRTVASRVMEGMYYLRYSNPAYWRYSFLRARILYAVQQLVQQSATESKQPRFYFANLLIPEPPFLFTRDGDRAQPFGPDSLSVQEGLRRQEVEFREAYLDQLFFTNRIVGDAAERIIRQSKRPVVVLIASTRGAPLALQPENTAPDRRYANLLAVRFPEPAQGENAELYPSISLANLFRVTLNRVFHTDLPLVDDRLMNVTDDKPFVPNSLSF